MVLLAVDTCLDACSAALTDASGIVLATRMEPMQRGHAERLVPMLSEVVAEAGATFDDVEAVAVTVGPGTFTGVRIGVAVARALALSRGAGTVTAPFTGTFTGTSLALLAATARVVLGETLGGAAVAACVDARKGQVYLQLLAPSGDALTPARLVSAEVAAAALAKTSTRLALVGSGAPLVADVLEAAGVQVAVMDAAMLPDARHLSAMALEKVAHAEPLYLRAPDAKPQAVLLPGEALR